MRASAVNLLNIVLVIALFVFSAAVWPALPERIPVHFGLDGVPDRWVAGTLLSWFALPLVATAVTALLHWIGNLLPRHPELLNIPDKKAFLSLTPERRAPVVDVVRRSLHIVSAILLGMMIMIQIGIYRTASGDDGQGLTLAAVIVAVVCIPLSVLVMLTRVQSRVAAGLRVQREEEGV